MDGEWQSGVVSGKLSSCMGGGIQIEIYMDVQVNWLQPGGRILDFASGERSLMLECQGKRIVSRVQGCKDQGRVKWHGGES